MKIIIINESNVIKKEYNGNRKYNFQSKIDYFEIENMCMWQQPTFLSSCTHGTSDISHSATCFFLK